CPAKLEQKLNKWVEKTGILGLGKEMVTRFVNDELVREIADMYVTGFKDEALYYTNLKRATEKALNELYKVKTLPLEKFIAGFNIRAFGERHTKKLISAGYNTLDKIRTISEEEFIAIDGLGEKLYNVFSKNIFMLRNEMDNILNYIAITEPVEKGNALEGKVFVITGKLNTGSRKDIQEKIENAGGKIGSSVNNKTDFLVNNDYQSNSSKNKKALDLNVDIISENSLLDMLN
ncbi:hypothetical protein KAR91_79115, partial [Candidatus Pacearchaeota archaeon]|nr:hypothetical protein [Candidatus Pacearchaeota archaeon]